MTTIETSNVSAEAQAKAIDAMVSALGADAVVIARPGARQIAEDDGLRGIHAALQALIDKVEGVAEGRPLELNTDPVNSDAVGTVEPSEAGDGGSTE